MLVAGLYAYLRFVLDLGLTRTPLVAYWWYSNKDYASGAVIAWSLSGWPILSTR